MKKIFYTSPNSRIIVLETPPQKRTIKFRTFRKDTISFVLPMPFIQLVQVEQVTENLIRGELMAFCSQESKLKNLPDILTFDSTLPLTNIAAPDGQVCLGAKLGTIEENVLSFWSTRFTADIVHSMNAMAENIVGEDLDYIDDPDFLLDSIFEFFAYWERWGIKELIPKNKCMYVHTNTVYENINPILENFLELNVQERIELFHKNKMNYEYARSYDDSGSIFIDDLIRDYRLE